MADSYLTAPIPDGSAMPPLSSKADKPDGVPEKFWDADTKTVRTDALLTSYLALEKKLSRMVPVPDTDDDRVRLLKLLGLPDTPDQYDIHLSSDLVEIDPELNARLHQKGFTCAQVQEVYDLATEKLVPLILEVAAEFQADREIERLTDAFGGPERWCELSRQLHDFGRTTLPKDAFDGMACSYDGVMALYKMMQANSSGSALRRPVTGDTADLDEKALRKMMQDPQYWRDRNPAYIAKVTDGFEKLYQSRR